MEKSEGKENHVTSSDTIVGGKAQVVISYEMCIVNTVLDGIKEPNICALARTLRKKRQDITQQGMMRVRLIKVKLKRGVQRC